MSDPSIIRGGLPLEEALIAFRQCCNTGPDRLFVTDSYLAPHLAAIRRSITGTITNDHAMVLREIVEKRERLEEFVRWSSEHGDLSWADYNALLARRAEEARAAWEADKIPRMRRQYEEWASTPKLIPSGHPELPPIFPVWAVKEETKERLAEAQERFATEACPSCGTAGQELRWRYASYSAFARTVLAGHGWKGWIVTCEPCRLGVKKHVEGYMRS